MYINVHWSTKKRVISYPLFTMNLPFFIASSGKSFSQPTMYLLVSTLSISSCVIVLVRSNSSLNILSVSPLNFSYKQHSTFFSTSILLFLHSSQYIIIIPLSKFRHTT
nr:MAG TPA: hypothetical protein [Caudoviricetes sp.]